MQTLIINGIKHQIDVEEEMPLLWVLRDELDLTGTKFGCGGIRYCSLPLSKHGVRVI